MTFRPTPKPHASSLQALADERRRVATPAEAAFEAFLNGLNNGVLRGTFQREWVCGKNWIVDFFFPEIRLAIEVDGGYHRTPAQFFRDLEREVEVERFEVTFVRFSNEEVFGDQNALADKLRDAWRQARRAMQKRHVTSTASPSATPKSAPAPKTKKKSKQPVLVLPKSDFYKSTRRRPSEYAGGWTSLDQGSRHVGDTVQKKYVDEGFGGNRDEARNIRTQLRADMRKRQR